MAHFDTTSIFRAKDVLKGHLCISGAIPVSILQTGTPADVVEAVKKQIDYAGKDGGYICSASDHFFDTPVENLKAFAAAARECLY